MRNNNETRRGGHLGRAPECVCSAVDTRNISFNGNGGQSCGLCDTSTYTCVVCDGYAGLYLTYLDGDAAGYSGGGEGALRFATEQEARGFGEQYEQIFRRPYLIEYLPSALEHQP